jgi:SOS-response transcriptional repressor LexA
LRASGRIFGRGDDQTIADRGIFPSQAILFFAVYSPTVRAMLTRRQKEVLDFVSRHIDKHGVAPTLHEIGRHLKLASVATVHKHLRKLEEKGAVRRLTHQSRALSVVPKAEATAGALVPLLGTVAAGTPIEPIETPARSPFPRSCSAAARRSPCASRATP